MLRLELKRIELSPIFHKTVQLYATVPSPPN